ncbi:rod shape-determining protein RodA [Candidatus Curtissbacteria bacterium]|nr:rod shape-determining protein RodA [Candidatus Curtissbacteria bacterium]
MTKNIDLILLALILGIGALSLSALLTMSKSIASAQLIFWVIGLVLLYISSTFTSNIWQKITPYFYILSVISLVLLFFLADPVRGSVRWIEFGFLRIQPSEIAKLSTILALALFFKERSAKDVKNLLFSLLIIMPPVLLVILQPDLGNTLAFFGVWLGITIASGLKAKQVFSVLFAGLITFIFLYEILAPYQKERLVSFFTPTKDPLGTGYHLIQSKIAIGSGQLFGRGLGLGYQSQLEFLPEAETDFIFATIVEQLGFVGGALLLILLGLVLSRLNRLISGMQRFGQLFTIGLLAYLLVQILVNIGMNMALAPVTGITLPLVSAGGSSLVTTLLAIGILLSFRKYN